MHPLAPPAVVRPSWLARRGPLLATAMVAGSLVAAAWSHQPPSVVISSPPPARTVVTVPITTPPTIAPPVIVNLPPPPPAPQPQVAPEPEAPPPRAMTPHLDAACILPDTDLGGSCDWDDGFPAIAADGSLVAVKIYPGDGARGNVHVRIRFIDTQTSKVVKDVPIVTGDESDLEHGVSAALRAKIARRVAGVQRVLDAGAYRSLLVLGDSNDDVPARGALHAELVGDAVRLIDGERVVWQARFPVHHAYPDRNLAEDDPRLDDCYPTATRGMRAWWDATTRRVVTSVSYSSGPCYCDDEQVVYVRTAAP